MILSSLSKYFGLGLFANKGELLFYLVSELVGRYYVITIIKIKLKRNATRIYFLPKTASDPFNVINKNILAHASIYASIVCNASV